MMTSPKIFLLISNSMDIWTIILKSFGSLNLTNDSNDYCEFIDSKISLNWKKDPMNLVFLIHLIIKQVVLLLESMDLNSYNKLLLNFI